MGIDLDYDKIGAAGVKGVLSSATKKADQDYINRAEKIERKYARRKTDDFTGKPVSKETKNAAYKGKILFSITNIFKKASNN